MPSIKVTYAKNEKVSPEGKKEGELGFLAKDKSIDMNQICILPKGMSIMFVSYQPLSGLYQFRFKHSKLRAMSKKAYFKENPNRKLIPGGTFSLREDEFIWK